MLTTAALLALLVNAAPSLLQAGTVLAQIAAAHEQQYQAQRWADQWRPTCPQVAYVKMRNHKTGKVVVRRVARSK